MSYNFFKFQMKNRKLVRRMSTKKMNSMVRNVYERKSCQWSSCYKVMKKNIRLIHRKICNTRYICQRYICSVTMQLKSKYESYQIKKQTLFFSLYYLVQYVFFSRFRLNDVIIKAIIKIISTIKMITNSKNS